MKQVGKIWSLRGRHDKRVEEYFNERRNINVAEFQEEHSPRNLEGKLTSDQATIKIVQVDNNENLK